MLTQEALKKGFDKKPEVQGQLDLGEIARQVGGAVQSTAPSFVAGSIWVIMQLLITLFVLFYFLRDSHLAIGAPVTLERLSKDGSGRLQGASMRVEASKDSERLTVFGPGDARYSMTPGDTSAKPTDIALTWTGGFVYDDLRGRAEVEGGAEAVVSAGDNERHLGRGTHAGRR